MAALPGFRGQTNLIPSYRFDGSIASATAPQLILPSGGPRSLFSFQNTSNGVLWLEFDGARAKATVTNGVVTSVTVTNAGFGYSLPPRVMFLAGAGGNNGGSTVNGLYVGSGYPGAPAPSNIARAHCVMTGSAPNMSIASIVIDNGGSGYSSDSRCAPYVRLVSDSNDPNGAASPYNSGAGSGYQIAPNQTLFENYSTVVTDAVAVWGGTVGQTFVCRIAH